MAIVIPEPEDYLFPDELDTWRDLSAKIDALADTTEVDHPFATSLHFRKWVFLAAVYERHARLSKAVDLVISPATGAITYTEVTIELEDA